MGRCSITYNLVYLCILAIYIVIALVGYTVYAKEVTAFDTCCSSIYTSHRITDTCCYLEFVSYIWKFLICFEYIWYIVLSLALPKKWCRLPVCYLIDFVFSVAVYHSIISLGYLCYHIGITILFDIFYL